MSFMCIDAPLQNSYVLMLLKRIFATGFFNLKSFVTILIENLSIVMSLMFIRPTCLCRLMSIMRFPNPNCMSFNVIYPR